MSVPLPAGPDEAAQSDRAGADQWSAVTETGRGDARAATERQLRMLVERFLRRVEERRAEAEGDGATDDGKVEIEQIAHRRNRLPDEPASALHDLVGRLGVWPAGDGLDRRARRLGFQATA